MIKLLLKNGLICYFYDFLELDKVINAVQNEKENKLQKYGLKNYQKYMEEQSKTDLYKRFKKIGGN